MKVHVLQTGTLRGNETFMRAQGWPAGLLRRRADRAFPVYSFVVEHPDGAIAIDAGLAAGVVVARWQRRFVPTVIDGPRPLQDVIHARGLDPAAVTRVILTHLDWDHVGQVGCFPNAEILVHRPEHEAATARSGAIRYKTDLWPAAFTPTLYDLGDDPYGPFPHSLALTERGDVRLVPLPGHSAGQVGVVVHDDDTKLLFAADHVLRHDWFVEDHAAGRHLGLGIFYPHQARETSHRLHRFLADTNAILLPSHDSDVPARLTHATRPNSMKTRAA